ncbi:MAG: O-antigen ligase family protein [Leptonema sp. (in: Bacteria)]|nr:O-antigen ligase family protein [Leptonema sp. (in: bacteria)]
MVSQDLFGTKAEKHFLKKGCVGEYISNPYTMISGIRQSIKVRNVFLIFLLLLSITHLTVLSVTSRNPALILGALPLAIGLHVWFRRKSLSQLNELLIPIIIILLITTTVADHLLNVVPFEQSKPIAQAYRSLQITILHTLPFVIVFIHRKPWLRSALPIIGLVLQLMPPYSYGVTITYQVPMYGRITALLYLALLSQSFTFNKNSIPLFLLPLASIPALFYGHSIGNTIDHILLWLIFGFAALAIANLRKKSAALFFIFFIVQACILSVFVSIFPRLHSINSNITSIHLEAMLVFSMLGLFLNQKSKLATIVSTLLLLIFLFTDLRASATTGLVVLPVIFFVFYGFFVSNQFKYKIQLQSMILIGVISLVAAATIYLLLIDSSHTMQARRLLWQLTVKGISNSPLNMIFGTGDFGPYHFFQFRYLTELLSPEKFEIIANEPYLISTHPHNEYLFMLFAGGVVYIAVFIYFIYRLFSLAKLTNLLFAAIISLLSGMILHGLTEPVITGATTGFIFFLFYGITLSFNKRSDIQKPIFVNNFKTIITLILSITAVYFITLSTIQLPVTKFWKQNGELFLVLRQTTSLPKTIETNEKQKEQIQQALPRLLLLTKLAPWESDYYRQAGDVELLFSLSEPTSNNQEIKSAALMNYCHAFALRSSPIHYAMIKRLSPNLEQACSGIHLRQSLTGYDPQHVLDLPNSDGLPLF